MIFIYDVSELYKVRGTCYYNDEMSYIPVLLEIMVPKVRDTYGGCRFLL